MDMDLNKITFSDAYAFVRELPPASVNATVTSPPGFWKRRQLPKDHKLAKFEMGQENTPEEYLAGMFDVFGEVYRATKPTGSLWVHLPDTRVEEIPRPLYGSLAGYAPGELMSMPYRFAMTMRCIGWKLMSEVIWSKTNANHFAAKHRPTDNHDKIMMFAKQSGWYYDWFAAQEQADGPKGARVLRQCRTVWTHATESINGQRLIGEEIDDVGFVEVVDSCEVHGTNRDAGAGPLFRTGVVACSCKPVGREAIQATPGAIVARCIAASTSEHGDCPLCSRPWVRTVKKIDRTPSAKTRTMIEVSGMFVPDCKCNHYEGLGEATKPVVLDPFSGSGTTMLAARMLGRDFIGSELDPRFVSTIAPARFARGFVKEPRILPLPG